MALKKSFFAKETNAKMEDITLNQWDIQVDHWCPAQIYYYFLDSDGGKWCIYLRWRHQDPWTAKLVHCDEEWDFQWDHPETKDIFEETEHTPGIITGYYADEEYPSLMERALEIVESKFPGLKI